MKTLPYLDPLQSSIATTLAMGFPADVAARAAKELSASGVGFDVLFSHQEGVPW